MDFVAVVDQVITLLRQRGRVAYRTLKVQFHLDDEALAALKDELLYSQRVAADEDGHVLVWTGDPTAAPHLPPPPDQALTRLPSTPPHLAAQILTARRALEGERKQITVLFADLKGSMELLADRDPEEARHLLDPVLERMMAAVHRYEGTVNQVMGDGIMALFGAPIAHEDHAVRACYAALAMQAAVQQYAAEVHHRHGVSVQIRVGMHAGEVVVRAIGNDLHMDYSAIGQTTHVAARMEQMALPGSILITAAVRRLTEGYIQSQPLGLRPVKGLRAPVEVFALVEASGMPRRLQAMVARGLTHFVGRQPELATLRQVLARAGAGQGQVVAIVGEPGVGKSRLVYEGLHAPHTQGWLVLESAAASYGTGIPYGPVLELLKRYAHVEDHDAPPIIRSKVTGQVLALDAALQESIPALLWLLDALPEDSPWRRLDPPQRRRRTLEALTHLWIRASQRQPLLLVCEDVHWIDAETQALLDRLVESVLTARLLLLVTYRPAYQHGWGSTTSYTQLRLEPLPPPSAAAFLHALLGDDPSLAALLPLLIARTGGNPFFLEESVRTLVETGLLVGERRAYRLAHPLDRLQVPATVQAVLAARIDRLPPEDKRLLQTAAVIGPEVPWPLVQAIAEEPEAGLQQGLTRLQAAEFLYEARLVPELVYTFQHALTHEVAYGSLLQERRRVLHGRIVAALEGLAVPHLADQVERLAHHALRGGLWDKAVAYYRQAGGRAAARSAYRDAVGSFEQALVALAQLPERRDTLEQAIDLRGDLRNALLPLSEYARLLAHLHAAESLAERLGDAQRLGRIACYLCNALVALGEHDRAMAAGQRALALATTSGAGDLQVVAQTQLGIAYSTVGDFRHALEISQQVLRSLTSARSDARFGQVALPAVVSRGHIAWSLAELGAFAEGARVGEEAVRTAEEAEEPFSLAIALTWVGLLARRQGALPRAIALLERGLGLSQTADFPESFFVIAAILGATYALAGRRAAALPLLEQIRERMTTGSHIRFQGLIHTEVSEALLLVGHLDQARALAGRLLALFQPETGSGYPAYARRLLSAIAAQREPPDIDQALTHSRQALTLAEELGMRPLQAHCHRGLGMLYATMGQQEQAHTALSTAIALYRAMDMAFWLPETEAARAQVEGR